MNWNQIEYVIRSASGQDGVYFISDGWVWQVLKAPESPAKELFLTLLAKSFGLDTPDNKVIRPDSPEYEDMVANIKPKVDEYNAEITAAQRAESLKAEFQRDIEIMSKRTLDLELPHLFFLMSDIRGRSLIDATNQDISEWYGTDEQLNSRGRKFFKHLGRLLVFDVLIRNVDRFIFWKLPGIGEIESALGNIGNIMVRDESNHLVVIDSLTDRNIEVIHYADAVKELIARTLNSSPDNLIERGRETIELTGYSVKENGCSFMLQGVREGISYIQSLNSGSTLSSIRMESMRQLPDSEEGKIDDLIQFIERIASAGFVNASD